MSELCYVYVIKSTSGHYKIGYSKDPDRRLRELRKTQGPYEYSLLISFPFPSQDSAKETERSIHGAFDEWRVKGEWFELSDSFLVVLGSFLETWYARENKHETPQIKAAFDSGMDAARRLAEYQELPY